jgi:hypothetical protein
VSWSFTSYWSARSRGPRSLPRARTARELSGHGVPSPAEWRWTWSAEEEIGHRLSDEKHDRGTFALPRGSLGMLDASAKQIDRGPPGIPPLLAGQAVRCLETASRLH